MYEQRHTAKQEMKLQSIILFFIIITSAYQSGLFMNFKYQDLMTKHGALHPCPHKDCYEGETPAFRWGFSPKDHIANFLPNFLYNEEYLGLPIRFNSLGEKQKIACDLCSVSLHNTLEASKTAWNMLNPYQKVKLKYTHVLGGNITKEMGVLTAINKDGHFEIFEYEGIDLRATFEVVDVL